MQKKQNDNVSLKHLGRMFAVQILFQIEMNESKTTKEDFDLFWEQAQEDDILKEGRIYKKAKVFAEKLTSGVFEYLKSIDELLEKYSKKWDISRMPLVDKNIMRIAVFEMKHCMDIPPIVSINEAIELSKEFSDYKSKGFINGILNNIKNSLTRSPRGEEKK